MVPAKPGQLATLRLPLVCEAAGSVGPGGGGRGSASGRQRRLSGKGLFLPQQQWPGQRKAGRTHKSRGETPLSASGSRRASGSAFHLARPQLWDLRGLVKCEPRRWCRGGWACGQPCSLLHNAGWSAWGALPPGACSSGFLSSVAGGADMHAEVALGGRGWHSHGPFPIPGPLDEPLQ